MKFNYAITFPTSLDTLTNPTSGNSLNNPDHATQHANANDAIEALEAKVGIDGSAVTTSHDYKLSGVTGTDKAVSKTGSETLTNKTLTSPVINVGSDATGDIYYRNAGGAYTRLAIGSTDQILAVQSGIPAWISNPSAVNGSTTVKGLYESATSSEITAGTATGGTGAALVVTPDALAASAPTFSAANLTNINSIKITRLAGSTFAANTTENTIFTTTITGGLLSSTGMIRLVCPWGITPDNNGTGNETYTIRLKYGGSTIISTTVTSVKGNGTGQFVGYLEAWIINNSATNSQNVGLYPMLGFASSAINSAGSVGVTPSVPADTTSAIDTTANQTLALTVQRSDGTNSSGFMRQAIIETIKN